MNGQQRLIKLAGWTSLAVALAGVLVLRLREPVYQGKSVSAWIEELGDNSSRSEEHTSELQSQSNLVCRLLLEKKKNKTNKNLIEPLALDCLITHRSTLAW